MHHDCERLLKVRIRKVGDNYTSESMDLHPTPPGGNVNQKQTDGPGETLNDTQTSEQRVLRPLNGRLRTFSIANDTQNLENQELNERRNSVERWYRILRKKIYR